MDLKRTVDLALASAGLIVLSPALAAIWMALSLASPGPVLYRARRVGRFGREFEMLKFRTMHVNAPDIRNPDGSTFTGAGDPRVTRLGRWLRRTSLDELPQLWNVLRGDMSIVGPRPELPDQLRWYSERDRRRLDVRPGITGLAQIAGRNDLPWAERRKLDVEYVSTRSLRLDLWIMAQTLPRVLGARGVFTGQRSHED